MELREVPRVARRRGRRTLPADGRTRLGRGGLGDREEPSLIEVQDPHDPRLVPYRDLRELQLRKHYEQSEGIFVVEGERALLRALEVGWGLESVLLLETRSELGERVRRASAAPVMIASPEVMRSVAGFHVHRGVLAIARRPPQGDPLRLAAAASLALVIEGVNDHENVGSLFRSAAAFGVGAVLLDPACCDPLYRRSVRVSLGHVLAVPFARLTPWPAGLKDLEGFSSVALTPSGESTLEEAARWCAGGVEKLALMVGSEADGLSRGALEAADLRVRIPMARGVDSLNVATAAAVALSRLRPCGAADLV